MALKRPTGTFQKNGVTDVFTIGFLGVLNHHKGWDVCLEACRVLAQNGHRIVYRIGGYGVDEERVKIAARDNPFIDFRGRIADDGKPEFFRGIDVLCLPSVGEGMPMVILEAMSYGVPTIATDVGGIKECIFESGILMERRDAESIVAACTTLITTPLLLDKLRESCIRRFDTHYSTERMVRAYCDIYAECSYDR